MKLDNNSILLGTIESLVQEGYNTSLERKKLMLSVAYRDDLSLKCLICEQLYRERCPLRNT